MYPPNMKSFGTVLLMATVALVLAACRTASPQAAVPAPEAEQVISEALKELYMAASTAPAQSQQQQNLILRMAQRAANGKELLLVMRAAMGVFPGAAGQPTLENQVRSTVMDKMMRFATLDQLIDYAKLYPVDADHSRRLVQRMFELGNPVADARVWYRIRSVAFQLKAADLVQQAQVRADQLTQK